MICVSHKPNKHLNHPPWYHMLVQCILIKLFLMSFFLQSQRKTGFEATTTPSPGQYEAGSLNNSRRFAVAPFGSTQPLNRASKTDKKKEPNTERRNKDFQEVFLVNDMNIKIKAQEQISSMFRSGTQRFNIAPMVEQPGPGQYNVNAQISRKAKIFSQTQPVHQFVLPSKQTVPSIPIDNLGFKEDGQNEMKKVQPPKAAHPYPGSYDISRALNAKGVVTWKAQKPVKKETEVHPGPGDYNYSSKATKSLSSCFHSSTDRFGKIKKFKEEKIPGPGQYNLEGTKKTSHNMSSESYFNSKTSRFHKEVSDNSAGPGMYFNELSTKNKSMSMTTIRRMPLKEDNNNSKIVNKKSIFEMKNTNPGPGQYRTNFGISYQLHKALLKKQTTDVFPKEKRVVFEPKQQDLQPGPGAYEQEIPRNNSKGKLWKKVQVVNLKQAEQPSPSPMDYPNFYNTIQAKVKQMNSKLTLTQEKPFNTGAQRFKHYANTSTKNKINYPQTEQTEVEEQAVDFMNTTQAKKVKRLVMTTIKVRVPFGISSNKYQQKGHVYEGPDYYQKSIDWVKPSFNIRGKIQ